MKNIVVAAFYKFADFPDYKAYRDPLKTLCDFHRIRGTILLASEGINGTIAGFRTSIDTILSYLKRDPRFSDLEHKESFTNEIPFHRIKVRLKKEIVTMGIKDTNPSQGVGTYVEPKHWNELIADPDVLVIDTRNEFEVDLGTFQRAANPHTSSFREFPFYVKEELEDKREQKVALFCTGGIRCEKATAFMLDQGFEEVYHLKGGILKYLETIPPEESLWEGECFVFDNRVAVDHDLKPGQYDQCHACRRAITVEDQQSPEYEKGVSCPHCAGQRTAKQQQRAQQRQKQMELAQERGKQHLGQKLDK